MTYFKTFKSFLLICLSAALVSSAAWAADEMPDAESYAPSLKEIMAQKALVDDPSSIDIKEVAGEKVTIYELRAAKSDIGKVIGKRGRTASAIRTLMNAVSARQGKRAVLEIIE